MALPLALLPLIPVWNSLFQVLIVTLKQAFFTHYTHPTDLFGDGGDDATEDVSPTACQTLEYIEYGLESCEDECGDSVSC